jgi:parallel beta-helix repeat protein
MATLNGFTLIGLRIQNYSQNGVFLRGVDKYSVTRGRYTGNNDYGIFPVLSTNGLIANDVVSGSNDTGIYVGQSTKAMIRDNLTFDNTIGIEIENTLGASVVDNTSHDNSLGLLSDVLPGLSPKETTRVIATGNTIIDNNRPNPVTDPTDILSRLPAGVGALFVATDEAYVTNNLITGNGSVGLGLISLPPDLAALDPSIDAIPDFDRFIRNTVIGNGLAPDPKLDLLGFPPADIVWDGTGRGNVFRDNVVGTSVPGVLPAPEPETAILLGPIAMMLLFIRRFRARHRGINSGVFRVASKLVS